MDRSERYVAHRQGHPHRGSRRLTGPQGYALSANHRLDLIAEVRVLGDRGPPVLAENTYLGERMTHMLQVTDAGPVADAFGLGADAVMTGPVDRGWLGQVWRLESPLGVYAVKESFGELSADTARVVADFQETATTGGVYAPRVIRTVGGDTIAHIRSELIRVYEWVDLARLDRHLDPADIGRLLAAMHSIQIPTDRRIDEWFTGPVGADGRDRLVAELHEADAPFADRLAELRDELVAVESLLEHPLQPIQVCHCDLFADNVRATSNGLCVIDWDNSGPESPAHELAVGLVEFGHTAKRVRCLVEAYEDAGGPGRIRRPADFTMAIAQLGHIGEFVCREWLRAESESDLAFASDRVEEFLSEPVTRSVVDELLDAVASQ